MKKDIIEYVIFQSPLGKIGLASKKKKLFQVCLRIKDNNEFVRFLEINHNLSAKACPELFEGLVNQFKLYFNGVLNTFNCKLEISKGTRFQKKVWETLQEIPYGETRSYKSIAKSIGKPKAIRAVGNANGKNPLPIIIPCHRVIQENGTLGGYTGGVYIKKFLLFLERGSHGAS